MSGPLRPHLLRHRRRWRGLSFGFFNPRGLTTLDKPCPDSRKWHGSTSPYNLLNVLTDNNLDVCGLGELHIKKTFEQRLFQRQLDEASDDLDLPHFTINWGCAAKPIRDTDPPEAKSGVAVVTRTDLLEGGDLVIIKADVVKDRDGRLMAMDLSWKGHVFRLCTAYLPSGETMGQHAFVDIRLEAVMADAMLAQLPIVLMGDFNFVDNWRLDRTNARVAEEERAHGQALPQSNWLQEERWPATRMQQLCKKYGLVDAFRELHRGRRAFTFFSPTSAARLDRIYISDGLFAHCMGAERARLCRKSDHLPVMMGLRALVETCPSKKLPKARAAFLKSTKLKTEWDRWLEAEEEKMQSEEGQVLLALHARLKQRMVRKTHELNRAHMMDQSPAFAEVDAGLAFEAAMANVEAQATGSALHALMESRRAFSNAMAQEDLQREMKRRFKWIRQGENPAPWLTRALLRSPVVKRSISALRLSNGTLTRDGPLMAAAVMEAWKSISAAPAASDERRTAQLEVLAAVRQHATPIKQEDAALAGDPAISSATVRRVGAEIDGGKAPGPDGIPFLLWMKSMPVIAAHLSRVFTAIGTNGLVPTGFLDGILKSLFKGNSKIVPALDPTAVESYRPITLLNTDYRLLGRILSSRATSILSSCIPPSQTAFLPGRLMGDNILTLQLLPSVLKQNQHPLSSHGVIAFLDFKKAYDTVDRSFLLELMAAFGLGEGMIRWYRTLLTGTYTSASVNGHLSPRSLLDGGIRQGGAESCGGYLPIPAALECLLCNCEVVGIQATEGGKIRGDFFADDGHIFLRSLDPADVALFTSAMDTFALATNQHLNLSKTKLLPIGRVSPTPPASVRGLDVVSSVTSLGIVFSNDANTLPDNEWSDLIDKAESKYQLISNLNLSVFGRSLASSTYGTSQLYHACEFSGPLPDAISKRHDTTIKQLVDLDLAPAKASSSKRSTMPGTHSQALVGAPIEGGFGVLPLEEHVKARWFMQFHRFILWTLGDPTASFAPKPLVGLRYRLDQAKRMKVEYQLSVEEKLLLTIQPVKPLWIDLASALLSKVSYLHPVETLLKACHCSVEDAALGKVNASIKLPPGPLRRWCITLATLGPPSRPTTSTFHHLSTILRFDAASSPLDRINGHVALVADVRQLQWQGPNCKPLRLLDDSATVKRVTRALIEPKLEWQRQRRLEQIRRALPLAAPPDLQAESVALYKRMQGLWKLRECPNRWKETAWRVQVNGVRAAGGHDIALPCPCGWYPPPSLTRSHPRSRHTLASQAAKDEDDRMRALACKAHVFGACPVAQDVLRVLQAGLPSSIASALTPPDLWLLRLPPSQLPHAVHEGVWSLVCALALHAMQRGHSSLLVLSSQSPPPPDALLRASNKAVGWLSYLLADVAASGSLPREWQDISSSHPFLHSASSPADDASLPPIKRLAARMPASLMVLPADL